MTNFLPTYCYRLGTKTVSAAIVVNPGLLTAQATALRLMRTESIQGFIAGQFLSALQVR